MRLMREATTARRVDYFNLPRPLWRKLKKCLPGRRQRWRRMGIFEKLMKRMAEYYAKEHGGVDWKWQAMDSKHSAASLGGQKTGKNPTHRGKTGAKIKLLVDGRGAPLSVVLTGANRHDKVSAIELICSVVTKS